MRLMRAAADILERLLHDLRRAVDGPAIGPVPWFVDHLEAA